jgi:hypothetical protein
MEKGKKTACKNQLSKKSHPEYQQDYNISPLKTDYKP